MKKLVIAAMLFAALSNQKAQAQEYFHGFGVQALVANYSVKGNLFGVEVNESNLEFVPSFMYKATLGFELSNDNYFAVSAYPSLGFNYRSNDMGTNSNYFGYQLPVLGELYFGAIDDQNFNIGLGLSYGSIMYDSQANGSVFGPMLSLGGQFNIGDQLYGVRGSFTYGLNRDNDLPTDFSQTRTMFGLSAYYLFGQ